MQSRRYCSGSVSGTVQSGTNAKRSGDGDIAVFSEAAQTRPERQQTVGETSQDGRSDGHWALCMRYVQLAACSGLECCSKTSVGVTLARLARRLRV